MKTTLFLLTIIFLFACSNKTDATQLESDSETGLEYILINDNLYSDSEGDLYLKSRTQENFETGKWIDVWLTTVYCDTCWTATETGWTDITELKDFVDLKSFHLDSTDNERGGDFYEDKNYRYFHKWMADGGTITLLEK